MKKLILTLFAAAAILFTACEKEDQNVIQDSPTETSIEFKIDQTNFDFKNEVPECIEVPLDYVKFTVVDGDGISTTYTSSIFLVDGENLTQVIKLLPGTYTVTDFLVYNANGTPGDESDDILVRAAPLPGSLYYDLMEYPLDLVFTVEAFLKKQYAIDVLCFEPLNYDDFGFTWFEFNDVRIERQCFFGDICTGKLQDYMDTDEMESPYADQPEGVQMDMPAIFTIKVYKNGGDNGPVLLREFNNESYLGVGQCLEVYWPNRLDEDGEEFSFELWVLLPSGTGFEYIHQHTWTFLDDNCPDPGEDGVVEFVLGSCLLDGTDLTLPFWMDLPPNEFTMDVLGTTDLGTYFDVTLSGIPAGYDVQNGTYGVWCGDYFEFIDPITYQVIALNSLAPLTWPVDLTLDEDRLDKINFFFNKLPLLIPGFDYFDTDAHSGTIQSVIWAITDNITPLPGSDAETFYNYVLANHAGYEVPPGGWAAIIFWDNPDVQLVFIVVDP